MQVEHTPLHVNLKLKSKKTDFVFALFFCRLQFFCFVWHILFAGVNAVEVLKRETVTQFRPGAVRKWNKYQWSIYRFLTRLPLRFSRLISTVKIQ